MKKIAVLILFTVSFIFLQAQQTYTISGTVTDKNTGMGIPSAGISIQNSSVGTFTDSIGHYELCHLKKGDYTLLINYIGYKNESIDISLSSDKQLDIKLTPTDIALNEVEVKTGAITRTEIIRGPEKDNPDANFLQVLNSLPGATTMNIGAGIAKPVIRGASANRVTVINSGIIQQSQQWGADHGLETNLFDIESATIHKGPYALLLGTSNITALEITPFGFPNKYYPQFTGETILWGASNNGQLGTAFKADWHNDNWYIRGSYRFMEYNDYRIPTNKVIYQDEDIALTDKRVPNTAGKEQNVSGTVGYKKNNITTAFIVSNNYQKTGLFELEHDHEEEHGEEDEHGHDHNHDSPDTSHSNIGMPYSTSNHFSVSNITEWKTSTSRLIINTGYQNNHRREFEHFYEHYEGQPAPETNDDLAVDFKLQTYSSNIRLNLDEDKKWKKAISANIEYQQNRVSGFEYFLPRYNQVSGGLAFVNIYEPVKTWKFQAGVRYDLAHTDITGFYDNTLAEHLQEEGYEPSIIQQYAQRAYDVNRNFGSFSGGITTQFLPEIEGYLSLKLNLAKSLRFPSANELAANGVHHAAFRYEIGDPDLKPEHGYTIDFETHYVNNSKLDILFNPFLTYYSNFIFLQPIAEQAIELYEEQPYKYSEAEAIYGGGEYKISWRPIKKLQLMTSGSIVLNRNIDDDKPLPFTPPFTMMNEIKFSDNARSHKDISYYQISVSHQWYADQNRVGFGEEKTKGTNLFNLSAGMVYKINKKWSADINMQVKNIFDTRYLNHMSLYRRLNIPEQGRNIQVFIRIPFNS